MDLSVRSDLGSITIIVGFLIGRYYRLFNDGQTID
jgi:hypothetical protein